MTVVLWILLALLALIVFVLAVPFGAHVAYIGGELAVDARVMGINIGVIPQKERKKPKKEKKPREKKPKKEKKPAAEEPAEKKKGLPMGLTKEQIPELLKLAFSTLDRFRRKFTVNYLMVHFVAACEDPYDTAMLYGYANAAAGIVEGLSGRGWDIRRRDIQVGVDFESTECRADAEVTVTISLGRILAVLLAAGFGFIKIKRAAGKAAAAEKAERKDNDGTDADPNGGIPAGQHG